MNIKELIDALQKYDPALPVLTPGFDEAGFLDIHLSEVWAQPKSDANCFFAYVASEEGEAGAFTAIVVDFS